MEALVALTTGSMSLKDLITKVRKAKTAAEERDIIKKESAYLRNAFNTKVDKAKARNLIKLMYIHMLGYPTQFGQMECLKLITQGDYSDKRVGYLALMIVLDERAETLMLVTNSMKNDLNDRNEWVTINALTAMGNICSPGMAMDLANDVERLMDKKDLERRGISGHMQSHIVKKALLTACRILRKQPDLKDTFKDTVLNALKDRNHAVVLAGITLMLELLALDEDKSIHKLYAAKVPSLCLILEQLHASRFNADYDVNQLNNPFLQVKVLKVLGILGAGNQQATEEMTDVLAKVAATRTSARSTTASAIAYQCAQTILQIEAIKMLRTHAVNIMGNFLKMRDNNMRYVALNTLVQAVTVDTNAVQRHRAVIVECVKDGDVSIRRRALDLIYALVNKDNIATLAKELLSYLAITDDEFKPSLTEHLSTLVQKFSPDERWYIDNILQIMVSAESYVKDSVQRAFVVKVSNSPTSIQEYSARQAVRLGTLHKDDGSDALLCTCAWVLGEYGQSLCDPAALLEDEEPLSPDESPDSAMITLIEHLLTHSTSSEVRAYCMMTCMKLMAHLPSYATQLHTLVSTFRTSSNIEIQQRSNELFNIIQRHGALPLALAEAIPPLDEKAYAGNLSNSMMLMPNADDTSLLGDVLGVSETPSVSAPAATPENDLLADLDDLLGGPPASANAAAGGAGGDLLDLLGTGTAAQSGNQDVLGGLDELLGPSTTPAEPQPAPKITAWSENGIIIDFTCSAASASGEVVIDASYRNSGPGPVTDFMMQAAVPKAMSVQMQPQIGGTTLGAGEANSVTQKITATNSTGGAKPLAMKLRITYTMKGEAKTVLTQVNNFPPGL